MKQFPGIFLIFLMVSCTSNIEKSIENSPNNDIGELSNSFKELVSDMTLLQNEVMLINATQPSIQRILKQADSLWINGEPVKASLELERALRISKNESSVYLRLAHMRLEEGLEKEARAFAAKGLLIKNISSWERFILKIYSEI